MRRGAGSVMGSAVLSCGREETSGSGVRLSGLEVTGITASHGHDPPFPEISFQYVCALGHSPALLCPLG